MANDIYVKVPDGSYIRFPAGTSPQVMSMAVRSQLKNSQPPMPTMKPVEMKESLAPKMVRGAASTLPVVGGAAGGILGAPAGGLGAPAGAGLGAAAGEFGRQAVNERVFGDEPPSSRIKNAGVAGGTAAALEGLGGAAIGLGNKVIERIALAKSPQESGNVVQSLMREAPAGFSRKALQRDLLSSYRELSSALGKAFRNSPATSSIDNSLQGAYQAAKAANASVPGVASRFDRVINAARLNAGVTKGGAHGYQASAQELFNFQKQLSRDAYTGNPGPVSEVLKKLLRIAYEDVGKSVSQVAPESEPLLKQITNLHAAQSAIKSYKPNFADSTLASAATHPRTTAALSPFVTGAAIAGSDKARTAARAGAAEVIP